MAFPAELRIHTHKTQLPLTLSKETWYQDSWLVVTDFGNSISNTGTLPHTWFGFIHKRSVLCPHSVQWIIGWKIGRVAWLWAEALTRVTCAPWDPLPFPTSCCFPSYTVEVLFLNLRDNLDLVISPSPQMAFAVWSRFDGKLKDWCMNAQWIKYQQGLHCTVLVPWSVCSWGALCSWGAVWRAKEFV